MVRELLVRDGGAALHVREVGGRGDTPPIVVVHGGPDFDHEYLLPHMDRLADRFRLVYYDQRGRGRSREGSTPADVSLASEIDDLDRVIAWVGARRVAVLGHSWGGLLAAAYAARRPGRVAQLVLANTAPVSFEGARALVRHLADSRSADVAAQLASMRASPGYRRGDVDADLAYHRLHFGGAVSRPELLDELLDHLRASTTPDGILAARAIEQRLLEETFADESFDLTPELRRIDVPTLVLHGADDLVPPSVARDVATAIPNARFVVLDGCGHFAHAERPVEFRAHVEALVLPGRADGAPQDYGRRP